jgi:heme-degrading monooxygenase HmoA
MNSPTLELVQFRLKPGVSEAAFLEAVFQTQAAIARLPGFLRREVLKNDEGLWVDVVHWQSKAEALAAAEAFAAMPEVAVFAGMIDETQMTMLHLDQTHAFGHA